MRGLTLIETIIYLALVSVLMTSALQIFASVSDSAGQEDAVVGTVTEGRFVAAKITYAVEHGSASRITLDAARHQLQIKEDDGSIVPLTSANVSATALTVTDTKDDEGNTIGKDVLFTLNGTQFSAHGYFNP